MKLDDVRECQITLRIPHNPKRPHTRAHQAFAELREGMTVATYLALEGQRPALDIRPGWAGRELRYCLQRQFIDLLMPVPPAPPKPK